MTIATRSVRSKWFLRHICRRLLVILRIGGYTYSALHEYGTQQGLCRGEHPPFSSLQPITSFAWGLVVEGPRQAYLLVSLLSRSGCSLSTTADGMTVSTSPSL